MSEQTEPAESRPEPGWKASQQEEELYPSTMAGTARPPTSTPSSEEDPAIPASSGASAVDRLRQISSSPASSDALEDLLAQGFQLVSGLATLATRRNLNLDVRMKPSEALGAAKPIARLIARRFQIRRELADATDAVATGSSLADYAGRILFTLPSAPPPDRRVAQAPSPTSAELAEEQRYFAPQPQPAPAPQPQPVAFTAGEPPVRDQGGLAVPGSGPIKSAFLDGFDE